MFLTTNDENAGIVAAEQFDHDLRRGLQDIKHYVFQLERSKSGKLHFQGRVSFATPKRMTEAAKHLGHVTVEHDACASKFYAMKEETRIAGPWSDKAWKLECLKRSIFTKPDFALRPWQVEVMHSLDEQLRDDENREVCVVLDEVGNSGKSLLIKYILSHKCAIYVPSTCETSKQIVEYVHSRVPDPTWHGIIVMDLPRSMNDRHWSTLAQGLEAIKNGFLAETRYHGQFMLLAKNPAVLVVCNNTPPRKVFSGDRWNIIQVKDQYEGDSGAAL